MYQKYFHFLQIFITKLISCTHLKSIFDSTLSSAQCIITELKFILIINKLFFPQFNQHLTITSCMKLRVVLLVRKNVYLLDRYVIYKYVYPPHWLGDKSLKSTLQLVSLKDSEFKVLASSDMSPDTSQLKPFIKLG